MRHQKKGRKFGKETGPRRNFRRILIANLINREKIETTLPRAKELKTRTEKMVTLAKKQNLAALRLLSSRLPQKAAFKLFHEIAPRYQSRRGGYLRLAKTGQFRKRDGAEKIIISFV
jgi:large subunit ribosomal protein L17